MFGVPARAGLITWAAVALAAVAVHAPLGVRADGGSDLGTVLSQQPNLTTFYALTQTYSSVLSSLPSSGITVLAPSDSAFQKFSSWNPKNQTLATQLLQYSVLQGVLSMSSIAKGQSVFAQTFLDSPAYANVTGGQNIIFTKQPNADVVLTTGLASRATVLDPDITFGGGLIQVIDSLTVVPTSLEDTATKAYTDLEAFVGAAFSINLEQIFADTPNVTLFIPRNAAFQAVAGALDSLSSDALGRVLKYHMVPGMVVPSSSLSNNLTLTTAAGGTLSVTRFNNDIFVNSAQIIQTDVLIANGVVQMLDGVLNPDDAGVPDTTAASQAPVFTATGATETGTAAPTPFVSDLPCTVNCVTSSTGAGGGVKTSSSKGAAAARCTGFVAEGLGMMGLAAGMAGMGLLGVA